MQTESNYYRILFFALLIILVTQRFFHLFGVIEEPMAWRQFDTEFFAYDFYKNGIDLMKPSVSWMGGYHTTILEFPIISAVISVFYSLFEPSVFYARLTVFLFFLGSCIYLYKLFLKLYYRSLAALILLVYMLLPLGVYYSRAVNIDFTIMFFSLSALYYFITGYEKERYLIILTGIFLSTLGFLIKAPYMFIIYFPLLYYIIKKEKISFALKTIPLMILPLIIFYFWQKHTIAVNNDSPDWFFIPDYFKFTDMSAWYFGYMSQRFEYINWERLLMRFGANGITFIGLPLLITGLLFRLKEGFNKKFMYYYAAGSALYLLIFFGLNVIHDYYQVPLTIVTSFFIAAGIDYLYRYFSKRQGAAGKVIVTFVIIALTVNGIWFTERWYYKPDKLRNNAAEFINRNTLPDELVIASIDLTDPRDPRILAAAHRYGWAIRTMDLKPALIDKLKNEGAQYLSITGIIGNDTLKTFLGQFTSIQHNPGEVKNMTTLYNLKNK